MNPLLDQQKVKFNNNLEQVELKQEGKYFYYHIFDIKYEILAPIIKDIQMVSQLIKLVKNHQLSDLIFIHGNNSYSIESRFYFNYRNIIDFYLKVIDFIETDYLTKMKYYVYKTGPISKNFYVVLSLLKDDENSSKLEIEIILLKDKIIIPRILKAIYGEFDYNLLYLSQAIKREKQNSFFFNSAIIKNEFCILSQILQNIKLIEYIINGTFKKIGKGKMEEIKTSESDNNYINRNKEKFIHVNEIYKVNLNKKNELKNWLLVNDISFKIHLLKVREDKMVMQLKILINNKEIENNESNPMTNLIIIQVRKLTNNSSFILNKCVLESVLPNNIEHAVKKIMEKILKKVEKLCEIGKRKL